jgi:hypothetical protein
MSRRALECDGDEFSALISRRRCAMRSRSAIAVGSIGLSILALALEAGGVPRPDEKGKTYVFPAGRYVLAGGPEAAIGEDNTEVMEDFALKPGQFILSGGPNATDRLVIDDDLEILQGSKQLFIDNDQIATTQRNTKQAPSYQGFPIVFVADGKGTIRIRVTDQQANDAVVGELWLHRHDGARRLITKEVRHASAERLPNVFFNEEIDLSKGFEMPAKKRTASGSAIDMPERPAMLLPRNKERK